MLLFRKININAHLLHRLFFNVELIRFLTLDNINIFIIQSINQCNNCIRKHILILENLNRALKDWLYFTNHDTQGSINNNNHTYSLL